MREIRYYDSLIFHHGLNLRAEVTLRRPMYMCVYPTQR